MVFAKAEASKSGKTVPNLKVIGSKTCLMVKEDWLVPMEISTKVNGLTTKQMGKEFMSV